MSNLENNTTMLESILETVNALPDAGGGSGGVTSWNDLTDKPDLSAVATTGSWDDLTDKPFGDSTSEWKQIASRKNTASISSTTNINLNSLSLSLELGRRYKIVFHTYDMPAMTRREAIVVATAQTSVVGQYISLGTREDEIYGYQLMADMPWAFYFKSPIEFPAGYDFFLYEEVKTITTLDEKYIPDTIARTADIPTVPTIEEIIAALPVYGGETE